MARIISSKLVSIGSCLVWLGSFQHPVHASGGCATTQAAATCYFVISNTIVENDDKSFVARHVLLLMDAASFTENDLRELARHFFEKYPEPDSISIFLYSHLDQVRDIGRGRPASPRQRWPQRAYEYPDGVVFRVNGNEIIRYAKSSSSALKTIVLKGHDPGEMKR